MFIKKPTWIGATAFIIPVATIVALFVYDMAAYLQNDALIYFAAALIGFTTAPIFTVAYETAVH